MRYAGRTGAGRDLCAIEGEDCQGGERQFKGGYYFADWS